MVEVSDTDPLVVPAYQPVCLPTRNSVLARVVTHLASVALCFGGIHSLQPWVCGHAYRFVFQLRSTLQQQPASALPQYDEDNSADNLTARKTK